MHKYNKNQKKYINKTLCLLAMKKMWGKKLDMK